MRSIASIEGRMRGLQSASALRFRVEPLTCRARRFRAGHVFLSRPGRGKVKTRIPFHPRQKPRSHRLGGIHSEGCGRIRCLVECFSYQTGRPNLIVILGSGPLPLTMKQATHPPAI